MKHSQKPIRNFNFAKKLGLGVGSFASRLQFTSLSNTEWKDQKAALICNPLLGERSLMRKSPEDKMEEHTVSNLMYQEKHLSKHIDNFNNWKDVDTRIPEKSDLFETICFKIKNNLCPDTSVKIGNRKFECHSIVLQSYMQIPLGTLNQREIILDEKKIVYKTFVQIYDWMLSARNDSHLKLSRENILRLLEAAKYLNIPELEGQCWAFIDSVHIFNEATSFLLYLSAKKLASGQPIMQIMLPRIQNFFLILVSSKNWIELDAKDVCAILSSNYIRVRCEVEVFLSGARWLLADWTVRKYHCLKVMQCVRFGLISQVHLNAIQFSSEFSLITSTNGVKNLIKNGLVGVHVNSIQPKNSENFEQFKITKARRRNYFNHKENLYEDHGTMYRCFMVQLRKIRKGEITLDSDEKCTPTHQLEGTHITSDSNPFEGHGEKKYLGSQAKSKGDGHYMSASTEILRKYDEYNSHVPKKQIYSVNDEELASVQPNNRTKADSESIISSNIEKKKQLLDRTESSIFIKESEAVLVFGGVDPTAPYFKTKKSGREIYRYNPFMNVWQLVGDMPMARHHHCTAYLNYLVYVAGGVEPNTDENSLDSVTNTMWSFNPTDKRWRQEISMIHARKNFGFIACANKIYAIGGQNSNNFLSSVECYDPNTQSWREVAPLKTTRMGLAVAVMGNNIWIAGGCTSDSLNPVTDRVESYNPRTNTWTLVTNLRYPRYFSTLTCVHDRLYVIGGASQTDKSNKQMYSVSDVETWNANEKEWKLVTELAVPRHAHSATILGTQILVIGGATTVYKKVLKSVECWCFDRQAWINGVSRFPLSLAGHSCVSLPPITST